MAVKWLVLGGGRAKSKRGGGRAGRKGEGYEREGKGYRGRGRRVRRGRKRGRRRRQKGREKREEERVGKWWRGCGAKSEREGAERGRGSHSPTLCYGEIAVTLLRAGNQCKLFSHSAITELRSLPHTSFCPRGKGWDGRSERDKINTVHEEG